MLIKNKKLKRKTDFLRLSNDRNNYEILTLFGDSYVENCSQYVINIVDIYVLMFLYTFKDLFNRNKEVLDKSGEFVAMTKTIEKIGHFIANIHESSKKYAPNLNIVSCRLIKMNSKSPKVINTNKYVYGFAMMTAIIYSQHIACNDQNNYEILTLLCRLTKQFGDSYVDHCSQKNNLMSVQKYENLASFCHVFKQDGYLASKENSRSNGRKFEILRTICRTIRSGYSYELSDVMEGIFIRMHRTVLTCSLRIICKMSTSSSTVCQVGFSYCKHNTREIYDHSPTVNHSCYLGTTTTTITAADSTLMILVRNTIKEIRDTTKHGTNLRCNTDNMEDLFSSSTIFYLRDINRIIPGNSEFKHGHLGGLIYSKEMVFKSDNAKVLIDTKAPTRNGNEGNDIFQVAYSWLLHYFRMILMMLCALYGCTMQLLSRMYRTIAIELKVYLSRFGDVCDTIVEAKTTMFGAYQVWNNKKNDQTERNNKVKKLIPKTASNSSVTNHVSVLDDVLANKYADDNDDDDLTVAIPEEGSTHITDDHMPQQTVDNLPDQVVNHEEFMNSDTEKPFLVDEDVLEHKDDDHVMVAIPEEGNIHDIQEFDVYGYVNNLPDDNKSDGFIMALDKIYPGSDIVAYIYVGD